MARRRGARAAPLRPSALPSASLCGKKSNCVDDPAPPRASRLKSVRRLTAEDAGSGLLSFEPWDAWVRAVLGGGGSTRGAFF
jgi:hypothetical protein